MDLSDLANTNSEVRESFLEELFNSVQEGEFSSEELEANLVPGLLKLCSVGISKKEDDSVFGRTFSTVLLAAIVELDSSVQHVSRASLKSIYDFTLNYLELEKDYRGYVNTEKGWAHSVAHVSDLISELLNHRSIVKERKLSLLHRFSEFIINEEMDILVFDEDQRISRCLYRALVLGHINSGELREFLESLVGEDESWMREFFSSNTKLIRLNNVQNICRSLLVMLTTSLTSGSEINSGINETIAVLRKLDMGFLDAAS